MALIDHQDDGIDIEPPHYRASQSLNAAVRIVVVGRVAGRVVRTHCGSFPDCRNRLDLRVYKGSLPLLVQAQPTRRLLQNLGGMIRGGRESRPVIMSAADDSRLTA